ncbi:hypothetical protein Tco_0371548 [Tanacetum coccineum]
MVVQAQEKMGKGLAIPTDPRHTPIITKPSTSQPQKKQRPRKTKRKETEIPQSSGPIDNVADEAFNEEMDDSFEKWRVKKSQLQKIITSRRSRRVESSEEESLGDQGDASKQGRIDDIDVDKDIYLVNVHRDEDIAAASTKEQEQAPTPIVSSQQPTQVKDKGKGKMVEEEPVKKMSKKYLLKLDEELALKLQAEEDKEERLARE